MLFIRHKFSAEGSFHQGNFCLTWSTCVQHVLWLFWGKLVLWSVQLWFLFAWVDWLVSCNDGPSGDALHSPGQQVYHLLCLLSNHVQLWALLEQTYSVLQLHGTPHSPAAYSMVFSSSMHTLYSSSNQAAIWVPMLCVCGPTHSLISRSPWWLLLIMN